MGKTVEECYKILGLDFSATEDEIKNAYKQLALKFHPDKNPNDPSSTEKFQGVGQAYRRITGCDDSDNDDDFHDKDELWKDFFFSLFREEIMSEVCCWCGQSGRHDCDGNEVDDFFTSLGRVTQFTRFESLKEQREANKKKFCDERKFSSSKCEQMGSKVHKPQLKSKKQLKAEQWRREKEIAELAAQINHLKAKSQQEKKTFARDVANTGMKQQSSSSQPDGVVDKKDRTQCSSQSLTNKRNVRKKKNRKETGRTWYNNQATEVPSKRPSTGPNVWHQRQQRHQLLAELRPFNETDEELQLSIALQLSRKQADIDAQRREISIMERELEEQTIQIERDFVLNSKLHKPQCDRASCKEKTASAASSIAAALDPCEFPVLGHNEDSGGEGEEWLVMSGDYGEESECPEGVCGGAALFPGKTLRCRIISECCDPDEELLDETEYYSRAEYRLNNTARTPQTSWFGGPSCPHHLKDLQSDGRSTETCPYGKNCCLGKRCKYFHPSVQKRASDGSRNKNINMHPSTA